MNKEVSFWSFLKTHKIEIPIIQRDYAQGRSGEKYSFLRKKFLEDIKNAILKVPPYQEKPLSLDFVYGTEKNGSLLPLDGQQRLTTLWLLHWYIAYKAGEISKAEDILKKFVYKTRKFSSEFCSELSSFSEPQEPGKGIVDHINNWINISEDGKQDPTFRAMLRMLGGTKTDDGIEGVFKDVDYKYCWTRLISEDAPVVFYYLPLEDFGLSDTLYIKMNARGKPLTPFESLKADLIDYLYKQKDLWEKANGKNKKNPWSNLLDPTEGIPVKLDTTWTKIFWKHHWKDGRIDEIYFAFLNRFFWNELFVATKTPRAEGSPRDYFLAGDLQGLDEKDTGEDKDPYHRCYRYLNTSESRGEYRSLDSYKFCKVGDDSMEISLKLFENLNKVLSNYLKYMDAPYEIPSTKWVGNFGFIPKYDDSGNLVGILKPQRVIFFALCKYFMEEDESASPDYNALKDWMRVVCNLVSGRISNKPGDHLQIRNNNEARMVIEYIDDYLCTHDVYDTQKWKVDKDADPFSFKGKCYEEYIKAKKILEDRNNNEKQWENKIRTAEGYSFFNGTIRFLYQDEDGEENWDNFDKKWKNVNELYFNEGTSFLRNQGTITLRLLIKQFEKADFERVLIWGGEGKKKRDAENNKNKMILGNGVAAWRSYLINPCLSAPVHKFLTINDKISDAIEGLKKQPCPEDGDEVKHALYLLTKTELLDYVIKVFDESGLRYENGHLVVRKFGSNEFTRGDQHVILCTKKYDFLLQTNVTREQFYKNYKIDLKIPNTNLHFECANICFSYEGYNFILYRDDNLIYLQPRDPGGWEGVPIKGTNTEYHFEKTTDEVVAGWENDEGEAKEEKIKKFLKALKDLAKKATENGDLPKPPSNS